MLEAENRLKSKDDFKLVMKTGEKKRIGPLMFFYLKAEKPARIGFVVSKKISNLATVRNLIRRQLRELFRTNPNSQKITGDLVVSVLSQPHNGRADLLSAVEKWLASL